MIEQILKPFFFVERLESETKLNWNEMKQYWLCVDRISLIFRWTFSNNSQSHLMTSFTECLNGISMKHEFRIDCFERTHFNPFFFVWSWMLTQVTENNFILYLLSNWYIRFIDGMILKQSIFDWIGEEKHVNQKHINIQRKWKSVSVKKNGK